MDLTPLDFAAAWHTYAQHNNHDRQTDEADNRFWQNRAESYDVALSDPRTYAETIRIIQSYLRSEDRLLDVGAGTGRFAVPLAQQVSYVTALDPSPDMLAVLRRKITAQNLANIRVVEASLEHAEVDRHDVVLAAWSLYRQPDMLAALQKLIGLTQRQLIIVTGDYGPLNPDERPHDQIKAELFGSGDPGLPNYLYFAGMLRQIGVRADIQIVYETRRYSALTLTELCNHFVPAGATPEQAERFALRLQPFTIAGEGIVEYEARTPVGIVTFNKKTGTRVNPSSP